MSSTTVDLALPARASRAEREFKPKSKVSPIGIAVMVAFHLGVGYVLVSGLGRHAVELVKKPLDATIIEEVKLPPPPPPPPKPIVKQEMPKVETPPPAYVPPPEVAPPPDAPSPIAAVQNAVPEAPPPAAPAAPVATPQPATNDIAVACPKQTRPVPPQRRSMPASAARCAPRHASTPARWSTCGCCPARRSTTPRCAPR
ncbi:MAG TPA: hypothetical protein VJ598_10205 [Albitalea sp.]|nr:hypothetical protein [Albitalea sp.]